MSPDLAPAHFLTGRALPCLTRDKGREAVERLALMSPHLTTLLGLGLCLGQVIHTQEGLLPKPSLRAEPGPVVPRGRPVSFVCSSLVWAQSFHLEKDGRPVHPDQISVPQNGSQRTQVTFNIPAVSEDTAGNYTCIYQHVYGRSERSEPLELQVAEEDSTPPSGPTSRDYSMENSIRLGLAGVVLLILVAILVEAGLSQRRSPQGPQE
ncbi:PREDICTED: leukocyte-associated immunoglobulin-like receptor 2 [Myotis davidii]|uniref:leukocyte-associated immunoglobulin-like receptor 2 n=1 Tax=Myotis davidii TaxID=225400 RepID=UPI000767A38B|nr:PREDICTED: leukocyte-associated immunoglobulin-like receptor 2 [Myotis davidii]